MLGTSDRFKGSTTTTTAPEHWSLEARARRLPGYGQQGQVEYGTGAAAATHRRLVLAALVVVR